MCFQWNWRFRLTCSDNKNKRRFDNKNLITRINESGTLTKHVSCKCECKFDDRKCNLNQKLNNDKCEKSYFWNPTTYSCKYGKYAGSIISDSVVICDKIIDSTKSTSTKTVLCKIYFNKFLYLTILYINYYSNIDNC